MMGDWTFFSNYGHVLVCLAQDNEARLRDVALEVGITERAVQKIVKDMQDAGFLVVSKHGRRNRYRINKRRSMRHGLESHCNVGKLLALVTRRGATKLPLEQPIEVDGAVEQDSAVASPDSLIPGHDGPDQEPVKPEQATTRVQEKPDEKKPKSDDTRQQGSLF